MSRQPAAGGELAPARSDLPPLFEHTRSINDDAVERRRTERAVRRAVAGDPEGMSYLYSRYSSGVYSYVRSIVRSRETAEDVTQQVFLKVMVSLERYDSTRAGFAAWILRVARNAAIDAIRESRGVIVSEDVEPSGHVPEIDHRRDSLRDALGGLTDG